MAHVEGDVKLYIEPFIGYRGWRWRAGRLFGITILTPWVTGVNEAACSLTKLAPDHDPAEAGCVCGFWAYDSREVMGRHLRDGLGYPRVLTGQVEMWGPLVRHRHGFRAKFARVVTIYDTGPEARHAALTYDAALEG